MSSKLFRYYENLKYFIINIINHRAADTIKWRIFTLTTSSIIQPVISSYQLYKIPLSQESCLQIAMQAYKDQKIKLILKAAKVCVVPEKTLYIYLKGRKLRSEIYINSYKLTKFKEELLLK